MTDVDSDPLEPFREMRPRGRKMEDADGLDVAWSDLVVIVTDEEGMQTLRSIDGQKPCIS